MEQRLPDYTKLSTILWIHNLSYNAAQSVRRADDIFDRM